MRCARPLLPLRAAVGPVVTAPLPPDESARLEALHAYQAFQTGPEPGFDRITSLAARTLGLPIVYVSLIGEETQWTKSSYPRSDLRETPRKDAFCAHTILSDDVFVIPDALLDERFRENPMVVGEAGIRFYVGSPLRTPSGHCIGTLCAVSTEPREVTPEMVATITDLAALVMDQMELRKWMLAEDSRQQRDSETSYRHLADSIDGMVFRLRRQSLMELEYLYVSPGSVALLGIVPGEFETNPSAIRDRILPEDLPDFLAVLKSTWETGAPWTWTGRVSMEGGPPKWIQGGGRCERHSDGSLIMEGLIYDVSEAKARELALSEAKDEAERANHAKSEFLSRMSHELRTPMNAILGFSQMLELEPLGGEAKEDLVQIRKAGEHLLGLINEVLDLSSVDAKKLPMTMEPVRFGEVVVETLGLLRPLMETNGIRLRIPPVLDDAFVLADRHRLKQIMINLVTNGIKYNREGGGLDLKVTRDGEGVVLDVSDEGAGISPEGMERLFAPFDRLGAEATGIEGTGLGLAISRGLAEQMGGSLVAQSVVGLGSTFSLRLPIHTDLEPAPLQVEVPAQHLASPIRDVLYIEDDDRNILLVQRILGRRPEVRLTTASTVASGLKRLEESMPGALLLDLNLPDGSGETIIEWVRASPQYKDLPIIVLSADAMPRQVEHILAAGADHYLTKPLNIPVFLETLDLTMKDPAA